MNQVDKELLISKGFMNEQERVNDVEIQVSALMEAIVFAGSILDNNLDLSKLMAVSLYIEELASKKNYLHIHLYVQRCFGDSRSGGWMVFMPPLFTKKFWKDMRCTSLCIFERL